MKKIFLTFIIILVVLFSFSYNFTLASETKAECIKRHDKMVNERTLNDIVNSHEIDLTGYKEHTRKELQKEHDLNPNNMEVNTLLHFFVGKSFGLKRIFIKENEGYVLYKRPDGNNVLKKIEKIDEVWLVMIEKENKGDLFYGKQFKCKDGKLLR